MLRIYPAPKQTPVVIGLRARSSVIDGLPFDAIENTLYYKRKTQREKDLKDILLIEEWIRVNKQ